MQESIRLVEKTLEQVIRHNQDGSKLFTSATYQTANQLADQLQQNQELNEACERSPLLRAYLCLLALASFRGDFSALPSTCKTATLRPYESVPARLPAKKFSTDFDEKTKIYKANCEEAFGPDDTRPGNRITLDNFQALLNRHNLGEFVKRTAVMSLAVRQKNSDEAPSQADQINYFRNFREQFYKFIESALPSTVPHGDAFDEIQRVIQAALIYWVLCILHNPNQSLQGRMSVLVSGKNLVVEGLIHPRLAEYAPLQNNNEEAEKPAPLALAVAALQAYRGSGQLKNNIFNIAIGYIHNDDPTQATSLLKASMQGFQKHRNYAGEVCAILFGFLLLIPGIIFAIMVAKKIGCFKRDEPTKSATAARNAIRFLEQIPDKGTSGGGQQKMKPLDLQTI